MVIILFQLQSGSGYMKHVLFNCVSVLMILVLSILTEKIFIIYLTKMKNDFTTDWEGHYYCGSKTDYNYDL